MMEARQALEGMEIEPGTKPALALYIMWIFQCTPLNNPAGWQLLSLLELGKLRPRNIRTSVDVPGVMFLLSGRVAILSSF